MKSITKGCLYMAGLFFLITLGLFYAGCSDRTFIHWCLLTVVMYFSHVVLKLSEIELLNTEIHRDVVNIQLRLSEMQCKEAKKELEETMEKTLKKIKESRGEKQE